MIQTCQSCAYHMSGNPPACNAMHTPIAGEIDCADWKANEASAGGLTPDGLYLRERLNQGQVPISPSLTLATLYRLIRSLPTPTDLGHRHQVHSMRSETVDFVTIATPNGLKWQYQGAVIID